MFEIYFLQYWYYTKNACSGLEIHAENPFRFSRRRLLWESWILCCNQLFLIRQVLGFHNCQICHVCFKLGQTFQVNLSGFVLYRFHTTFQANQFVALCQISRPGVFTIAQKLHVQHRCKTFFTRDHLWLNLKHWRYLMHLLVSMFIQMNLDVTCWLQIIWI